MMNEKTKPSDNQKKSENLATLDLPFTKARVELTGAYVRNAVPREEHYQTWLKQHYDMASSLGLEKDTTPGEGLALDTNSKKIKVKIDDTAGLAFSDKGLVLKLNAAGTGTDRYVGALKCINNSGVFINVGTPTNGRKGLKGYPDVGSEGVGLGIDHDASLVINSNGQLKVNYGGSFYYDPNSKDLRLKVHPTGGIDTNTNEGIKVLCESTGQGHLYYAGAIKTVSDGGLFINVGDASHGRKGLKGYPEMGGRGIGLGIDHDPSLVINSSGQLKVNYGGSFYYDQNGKNLGLKVHPTGGIDPNTEEGIKVLCESTGQGNLYYAGAIKTVSDGGLFINVGDASHGRKGLKGYPEMGGRGIGLGIDYDASLKIDGTGKIGINTDNAEATIKMMGKAYGASTYVDDNYFTAYLLQEGDYRVKVIAHLNLKSPAVGARFCRFPIELSHSSVRINSTSSTQSIISGNTMGFVAIVSMNVRLLSDANTLGVQLVDLESTLPIWIDSTLKRI